MNEFLSALAGGLVALLGSISVMWYNSYKERKSLSQAILGEIQSLISLIEKRDYVGNLERWKREIDETSKSPNRAFMATPRFNYFAVYDANLGKIGCLPWYSTIYVTKFYVLTKSLIEDFTNKELYSREPHIVREILDEDIELLKEVTSYGKIAVNKLKKGHNNVYKALGTR